MQDAAGSTVRLCACHSRKEDLSESFGSGRPTPTAPVMRGVRIVLMALAAPLCRSLVLPGVGSVRPVSPRANPVRAGLFDGMFGESEAQKAAKEEQWRIMQEMQDRRRDPSKQAEYFEEVDKQRRAAAAVDADLKQLQARSDGGDKLGEWMKLKEEGKVKAMDDTERDADSGRLGSAGLIGERIDEKLPYIDSGYVDESAPQMEMPDIMGGLKKLGDMFGKKE